jgi:hypothetical protein
MSFSAKRSAYADIPRISSQSSPCRITPLLAGISWPNCGYWTKATESLLD